MDRRKFLGVIAAYISYAPPIKPTVTKVPLLHTPPLRGATLQFNVGTISNPKWVDLGGIGEISGFTVPSN